jgi:hypothetical protein
MKVEGTWGHANAQFLCCREMTVRVRRPAHLTCRLPQWWIQVSQICEIHSFVFSGMITLIHDLFFYTDEDMQQIHLTLLMLLRSNTDKLYQNVTHRFIF